MTPEAIVRELEEWIGVIELKKRTGFKPNADFVGVLKDGVKAGHLEQRWWYPSASSTNRCQWQVRKKKDLTP